MLQFLNKNRLGFVEFWKIIPVFAQGKELYLNSRNLEVGKEQCTASLGVAGKATGGFEYQQIGCCEILEGCSSFRTWKRS